MANSKLHVYKSVIDDYQPFIKNFYLKSDDIIIYSLFLPDYTNFLNEFIPFLNPEERNKSERFLKEKDGNQFIICRVILKFILAAYTKSDLYNIILNYTSNKKPYLESHSWLNFNISHAQDYAVIAISFQKVGIDIEYIAKDFDFMSMLPDIFTGDEINDIHKNDNKALVFYKYWTRKEAFAKGLGIGIDDNFKKIPCQIGQHLIDDALVQTNKNWQLFTFYLTENYLGAVAIENSILNSKNIAIQSLPNTLPDLLSIFHIKDK